MAEGPFFSVVIPWHGNADDLRRAVASVRAQGFSDYETVIVCNGPAFSQARALADGGAYDDCRIVADAPGSAATARNAGIAAARGEWIAFLDVDDVFRPGKLARIREAIAESGADMLWSRGMRVRGPELSNAYPPQLFAAGEDPGEYFFSRGANFSASGLVARTALARETRFDPDMKIYEEVDFVLRAHATGARCAMLAEPLFEWRDDRAEGRLSRPAPEVVMAAATRMRPVLSDRAFHALLARRVAQHVFPRRPGWSLGAFWRGWRLGGVPLAETAAFMLRGLLPAGAAGAAIDLKTRLDGWRAGAGAAPAREN